MDEQWQGAFEDDNSQKRPIEEHVQLMLTFVQEHETILQNISKSTNNSITKEFNSHYNPVQIALDPIERVFPQDLIAIPKDHYTNSQLQLKKILSVLFFLQDEINELKNIAENRFYRPLLMFGQLPMENGSISSTTNTLPPGEKEVLVGKFLPFLQELCNFIDRCYSVSLNLIQQMSSLSNPKDPLYKFVFQLTHFSSMILSLGDLLNVLITIDCIIQQNESLLDSWSAYKNMITFIRHDPNTFSSDQNVISKFERLVVSIDQSVMIGEIFKGCIEQNYELLIDEDNREVKLYVRQNSLFLNEILTIVKQTIENSLPLIGTSNELYEKYDIMKSLALYILYRQLLPSNIPPDNKLHKVLWNLQKTLPFIILVEKVLWTPAEFLQTFLTIDTKKLEISNPTQYRKTYMTQFDNSLNQRVSVLISQSTAWLVLTESKLQASLRYESSEKFGVLFDLYGNILLKGLSLILKIYYYLNTFLNMHSILQIPITKSNFSDITLLIEYMKAIELTFNRKSLIINELLPHIIHLLADALYKKYIEPITLKLNTLLTANSNNSGRIELLLLCNTLENILKSTDTYTFSRQTILKYITDIIITTASTSNNHSIYLNEKDVMKIKSLVRKICILSNLLINIRKNTNLSFLYFHFDILTPIISGIYQVPQECYRIQYVINAFNDSINLFHSTKYYYISKNNNNVDNNIFNDHPSIHVFVSKYRQSIIEILKNEIIMPLSREIETDLRLHIHTKHLNHMSTINPKLQNFKSKINFFELNDIKIIDYLLNIKKEVTHYLDMNFYNLTTIALHDWKMYSEMRSLAYEKYSIKLLDNFLPMGSLDQGLDVLQIMRNIHIFVSRFSYNMNIQQFIEYRSTNSSKHINTIKIQSIAASIRQHGLGVCNTTVNYTYQFLIQKFHVFREFLHDDYISAYLSREFRWYKKHRNEPDINNMYPYERAFKFVKDIKKLGINENGKSFLDLFRVLITEIGNALGYVRMVRSASMYYCSEAVKYLPELDDIVSFEGHSGKGVTKKEINDDGTEKEFIIPKSGANLSDETVRAGKNLDDVISTLIKNFGEGSDYFKVLVNVFQAVLLTEDNEHLKTFFMIVPALCISWADASLQAKDNMYKATRGVTKEMYFSDDGFAMGIAYCLAITKQTRKFEALHWVDSVRSKLKLDTKQLEEQQKARAIKEAKIKEEKDKEARKSSTFSFFTMGKKQVEEKTMDEDYEDMEEVHLLQLNSKRLEAMRRETEQLFFSLSSAQIFFKRTDVDT